MIVSTVVIGAVATYSIYKYINRAKCPHSCPYPEVKYSTTEYENYDIHNPARIYKYKVPTGSFIELESKYKMDLMGNYKKKQNIDSALKDYLKTNNIYQNRAVINTEGWVGDFIIETNVNPNTLVIDIDNNSLEEANLDGLNKKLL
jgi:hypothetical protein